MKKLVMMALVLSGVTLSAQTTQNEALPHKKEIREKMAKWSPEQHAQIQTQQMSLHLDLSEAQEKEVYALELAHAEKRALRMKDGVNRQDMTPDELHSFKQERLEEKKRFKEAMKRILTPEQYEKWGESHRGKRAMQHRKSRKNKG